ncbi:MAG: hypothetical protein P8Y54_13685 [Xanthomonadales bacterium]
MRTILLVLTVMLPLASWAEITPETRWNDPSKVVLNVEFPGDGYHAAWDLYRCACGDLLVHSELDLPGESEKGETLLVGGRAVLYRGFSGHESEYGASLDAPALMMQLAAQLLERLEPGGPSRIGERTERQIREETQHLYLDTGTATGEFQAPWTVSGTMWPIEGDARRFDVKFDFSVQTAEGVQNASMRLRGTATYARTPFPVGDDEPLDRWTLAWRDPADPAQAAAEGVDTLADLRDLLEAD